MESVLKKVETLLKSRIGLDISTIGRTALMQAMDSRSDATDSQDWEIYYNLINTSNQEFTELLELLVIPETWFFRDTRPFEDIKDCIMKGHLNKQQSFKILSLPCSTGEEPYSITMFLMQSGITNSLFTIDAADISPRAIEIAKHGIYRENSFRGEEVSAYKSHFFTYNDNKYQLHNNIIQSVNFRNANILNQNAFYTGYYDFILCRNLLIYFDEKTKQQAYTSLHNTLKADGRLYIGHSEFGSVPDELFVNQGSRHAFALVKSTQEERLAKQDNRLRQTSEPRQHSLTVEQPSFTGRAFVDEEKQSPVINSRHNNTADLKQARKLADQQNFSEAVAICMQSIEEQQDMPEAYFLLGLIKSSQGQRQQAENFYRKALFLDPEHYESLIHLALLLSNSGDQINADLFRKRAERISREKSN